jgi:hypothetical protein
MTRYPLLLILMLVGLLGFRSNFAGQGAPINLAARQETYRGDPLVVVSFSDTNSQTVVRSDVRRRSNGADTFWVIRGYTTGKGDSVPGLAKRMTFRDGGVTFGKVYRYQARDSVTGAALTAWSDSVSITVTKY